jgi:hypothetical protein
MLPGLHRGLLAALALTLLRGALAPTRAVKLERAASAMVIYDAATEWSGNVAARGT